MFKKQLVFRTHEEKKQGIHFTNADTKCHIIMIRRGFHKYP